MCAAAVVIMCLGTVIPVATYAAPVLCMAIGQLVRKTCGNRMAWAWYGATAILSLLLAPDKEAAAVFAALGYYPVVKPWIDRQKGKWLIKLVLFNGTVLLLYWFLLSVLGMEQLLSDFDGLGFWAVALLLAMGNVTFFLLDFVLGRGLRIRK